jgi:glycine cleavage system H protein
VVVVGITDFAQSELGDIVYVEMPSVGSKVSSGETFGNVESVKSVSDLFSPVAGVVADINTRLSDSPELLNSDPYGEGWLIRVEPQDAAEVEQLLTAGEYADYIGAEAE